MRNINEIKAIIAAFFGTLTGIWGWLGWLVVGWVFCMVLDYLTGSASARKAGEWSSAKARDGIWHKLGMIVVVLVAGATDILIWLVLEHMPVLQLPFAYSGLVCPVVLVWYIVTELGSMAENAVEMGAPCPPWLRKGLAISKDMVDKIGGEIVNEDHTDH